MRRASSDHLVAIHSLRSNLGNKAPLVLSVLINNSLSSYAMVDSGATSLFIDFDFLSKNHLEPQKKKRPEILKVVDGRESLGGAITHEIELKFSLGDHSECAVFQVTKLSDYPIILGKAWLDRHDPAINWSTNHISFSSKYCLSNCLKSPEFVSATLSETSACSVPPLACSQLVKNERNQIYAVSVSDIRNHLEKDKKSEVEEMEELLKKVPSEYHDLLPLFTKKEADKLPPHRYVDHAIELEEGKKPPFGPLYNMSNLELQALGEYLDENQKKGFIRPSTSSSASPVLFVRKPGGGLRFCVDYRGLNAITKKNRYPLPLIDETLRQLQNSRIFTRLDLRGAYNLIRIRQGDEHLTAFRTRYGLFEYLVMPFGLTNAPATCQQFVNDTLRQFLDRFCVVYLDDILIYSQSHEEHKKHVRLILETLLKAGLYVKGEKCEFFTSSTTFLGFVVSTSGISMDPTKVSTITEWKPPANVKDLQSFLGFANFYRRFIGCYSAKVKPLTNLLKKNSEFTWGPDQEKSFSSLKEAFCSAPILRHFDPELETILETDASDTTISGILSQYFQYPDKRLLHPIAYFSRSLTPAERNYGIGDKELLAIVASLTQYRPYVVNLMQPLLVITDHSNLTTFASKQILNRRQARWANELSELNFKIVYRPGSKNQRADILTRRSGDRREEGEPTPTTILGPEKFRISSLEISLTREIIKKLNVDTMGQSILRAIRDKLPRHPHVDLGLCKINDEGLLEVNGLVYIPGDMELQGRIISSRHSHPAAGHPGQAATFELISRDFWWPGMRKSIARYIRNCETCQRIKPVRHAPYGYLKSLEIPQRRWESVSLDFITGLPISSSYDAILVVVDRLTKMAHFVPCNSNLDSQTFAQLYRDSIFRLHGLPDSIVSDRGSLFTSDFTKDLCKLLVIRQRLSTSFHPQTDGQTERVNAILEQYLRGYISYQQDNWFDFLALAEFAYNNSISATTKITPFFANYGYNPRFEILRKKQTDWYPTTLEVQKFQVRLRNLEQHLRQEIRWAQQIYSEYANNSRISPPVIQTGSSVWLLRRNIRTTRPSDKLDYKRLGPFKVLKKISTHAYKLELPSTMKIHPVFHVSMLEPVASDPLPGQKQVPPPPVIVDGELEFQVDEILDAKRTRNPDQPMYLVKWTGESQLTWEPYDNVKDLEAFDKFITKYPEKPRPTARGNSP